MKWTFDQLAREAYVCYETRLGILGVVGDPTPEQHAMAKEEADKLVEELKNQDGADVQQASFY